MLGLCILLCCRLVDAPSAVAASTFKPHLSNWYTASLNGSKSSYPVTAVRGHEPWRQALSLPVTHFLCRSHLQWNAGIWASVRSSLLDLRTQSMLQSICHIQGPPSHPSHQWQVPHISHTILPAQSSLRPLAVYPLQQKSQCWNVCSACNPSRCVEGQWNTATLSQCFVSLAIQMSQIETPFDHQGVPPHCARVLARWRLLLLLSKQSLKGVHRKGTSCSLWSCCPW